MPTLHDHRPLRSLHFCGGLIAPHVELPLVEVPGSLLFHALDRRVLLELVDAQVSPRAEAAHLLAHLLRNDRCMHWARRGHAVLVAAGALGLARRRRGKVCR